MKYPHSIIVNDEVGPGTNTPRSDYKMKYMPLDQHTLLVCAHELLKSDPAMVGLVALARCRTYYIYLLFWNGVK